jgi:hypothetical protein
MILIYFIRFPISKTPENEITKCESNSIPTHRTILKKYSTMESTRKIVDQSGKNIGAFTFEVINLFSEKLSVNKVQSISDDILIINAIFWYVYNEIEYTETLNGNGYVQLPFETLDFGKGDSEDFAVLIAAMSESIGMDAIIANVDTERDGEEDQALCLIYYSGNSEEFFEEQMEMGRRYKVYPKNLRSMYISEPFNIFLRSNDKWIYHNKYDRGIWVSLENWDYCTIIQSLDVEYKDFMSSEYIQEMMYRLRFGVHPQIGFEWRYFWSGKYNDSLIVEVNVMNNAGAKAKNVTVWAELYTRSGVIYDKQFTKNFNLEPKESSKVTLNLSIPKKLTVFVKIRVSGQNFDSLEDSSSYFQT